MCQTCLCKRFAYISLREGGDETVRREVAESKVGWERLKGRGVEKNRERKKGTRRRKRGKGKEKKEMKMGQEVEDEKEEEEERREY